MKMTMHCFHITFWSAHSSRFIPIVLGKNEVEKESHYCPAAHIMGPLLAKSIITIVIPWLRLTLAKPSQQDRGKSFEVKILIFLSLPLHSIFWAMGFPRDENGSTQQFPFFPHHLHHHRPANETHLFPLSTFSAAAVKRVLRAWYNDVV